MGNIKKYEVDIVKWGRTTERLKGKRKIDSGVKEHKREK